MKTPRGGFCALSVEHRECKGYIKDADSGYDRCIYSNGRQTNLDAMR